MTARRTSPARRTSSSKVCARARALVPTPAVVPPPAVVLTRAAAPVPGSRRSSPPYARNALPPGRPLPAKGAATPTRLAGCAGPTDHRQIEKRGAISMRGDPKAQIASNTAGGNGGGNMAEPAHSSSEFLIRPATLRQLQVFEAIVRLRSFTKAAEELFVTQPTVSLQMIKLADSVGRTLLEPVGRHTRASEAVQELYQACRTIFRALGDLESKFADLKGLRAGKVRLGVITTAKYFAPEMLGEFCKRYSGVDISLKVSNRERILERILSYEDDLYVLGEPTPGDLDLVSYTFATNPQVVMAARKPPLMGQQSINLTRIAEEPFILRE